MKEEEVKPYKPKATIKWNGGLGALLCNWCGTILATGWEHEEDKAHYCKECETEVSNDNV